MAAPGPAPYPADLTATQRGLSKRERVIWKELPPDEGTQREMVRPRREENSLWSAIDPAITHECTCVQWYTGDWSTHQPSGVAGAGRKHLPLSAAKMLSRQG